MVNRIYDLYDDLEKHRIMLSFKGVLSPELIGAILNLVEHRMNASEPDHRVRKRVFNVVMECLQNLYHHNNRISDPNGAPLPPDERQGVVMIAHDVSGYSVLTGNFMAQSEVEELKARLDRLLFYHRANADNERLAEHLNRNRNHLFTFFTHGGIDATNHRAERAIRPAVLARKISGGSRTGRGALAHACLTSVDQSARQQGRDFCRMLADLLRGRRPSLAYLPAGP